jgi:hypothetical protein
MKSYHFDVGNSNDGPLGFCATIRANNKKEALERLQALLPGEWPIDVGQNGNEYLQVYFNSDHITIKDINEVTDK